MKCNIDMDRNVTYTAFTENVPSKNLMYKGYSQPKHR